MSISLSHIISSAELLLEIYGGFVKLKDSGGRFT